METIAKMKCDYYNTCGNTENCSRCDEIKNYKWEKHILDTINEYSHENKGISYETLQNAIDENGEKEVLNAFLEWNGIIGYTNIIIHAVAEIYGICE